MTDPLMNSIKKICPNISKEELRLLDTTILEHVSQSTSNDKTNKFLYYQKYFIILAYLSKYPEMSSKGITSQDVSFLKFLKEDEIIMIFGKPIENFYIPQLDFDEFLTALQIPNEIWSELFEFFRESVLIEETCISVLEELKEFFSNYITQKFPPEFLDHIIISCIVYSLFVAVDWLKDKTNIKSDSGLNWRYIFRLKYFRNVLFKKINIFTNTLANEKYGEAFYNFVLTTEPLQFAFLKRTQLLPELYKDKIERRTAEIDKFANVINEDDYTKYTSHIQCDKCKTYHTGNIQQIQIRSADEPPNTYYYCYKCKRRRQKYC